MNCNVCGGTGFVKAAPLSPTIRCNADTKVRALWHLSVAIPCFVCSSGLVGVAR